MRSRPRWQVGAGGGGCRSVSPRLGLRCLTPRLSGGWLLAVGGQAGWRLVMAAGVAGMRIDGRCASRSHHAHPACPRLPPPAEYEPWLAKGTAGFQPPSEASRRALEGEPSLAIGAKKLPVEGGLRGAAADISAALQLDEVQAYILLRRWVAKAGPQAVLPAGAAAAGGGGASLSPDQRVEVVQLYYAERLYLLKSIESLLWEGERECCRAAGCRLPGPGCLLTCHLSLSTRLLRLAPGLPMTAWECYVATGAAACAVSQPCSRQCRPRPSPPPRACLPAGAEGGPLLDVIEGTLSSLLGANLEDATFQALRANLEAAALVGGPAAAAAASAALAPVAIAAFGGAGGGSAGAVAAAVADAKANAAAVERCSLLHILILIYYHPRKQCTPDRFLSLAKLFHARLFTRTPLPRAAGGGALAAGAAAGELSPAQLSIKLVRHWLALRFPREPGRAMAPAMLHAVHAVLPRIHSPWSSATLDRAASSHAGSACCACCACCAGHAAPAGDAGCGQGAGCAGQPAAAGRDGVRVCRAGCQGASER